jgi:hypothetical protein
VKVLHVKEEEIIFQHAINCILSKSSEKGMTNNGAIATTAN